MLALLRPDVEVTLLEPRARRWAFLREAVRQTGRPAAVVRARHDEYGGPPARTVTLRALRLPVGELLPLLAAGGQLLAFGPPLRDGGTLAEEPAPPGVRRYRRADVPRET